MNKNKTKNKTSTSWGKVADWYEGVVGRENSYQKKLVYPYLLRMSSPQKGERVLDVACGEGSWSAELIKKECLVFGIDISHKLIEIARKKAKEGNFKKMSAEDLSFMKEKNFDKIFIILAIQNMEKADRVISESARLLKKEGKLYLVLNHPCFRIPRFSEWGWDENFQYRKINHYLSESKAEIIMHPGGNTKIKTISFHRPLQYFFKAFYKAGIQVSRIEEWISNKKSQTGPREKAENKARKEIPLFMAIECVKK